MTNATPVTFSIRWQDPFGNGTKSREDLDSKWRFTCVNNIFGSSGNQSGTIHVKYTGPERINPDLLTRNFEFQAEPVPLSDQCGGLCFCCCCICDQCSGAKKSFEELKTNLVNKEIDTTINEAKRVIEERVANIGNQALGVSSAPSAEAIAQALLILETAKRLQAATAGEQIPQNEEGLKTPLLSKQMS